GGKTRGRSLREGKPDTAAHRVPKKVGPRDGEGVKHGHDICGIIVRIIGLRVMRLIAGTMPPGIDEDESVVWFQCVHIPELVPACHTIAEAVLEHQRRAVSLKSVMDLDSVIVDRWHTLLLV